MALSIDQQMQTRVVSPLSIDRLRVRKYEAQPAFIKEVELPASDFRSFLISYQSDGLKVYARLSLPAGDIPSRGFPVVVFAHGVSPNSPVTDYLQCSYFDAWINAYTQAGFATVMPAYRGHGVISGIEAQGKYYVKEFSELQLATPFYAIDVLNLVAGLDNIPAYEWKDIGINAPSALVLDTDSMFMAAHSMGVDVGLKVLTVASSFKASSLWAGVSADIWDIVKFYTRHEIPANGTGQQLEAAINIKWEKINSIASAMPYIDIGTTNGLYYLENLVNPVILHQGTRDAAVDPNWAISLHNTLLEHGKESVLYLYENNDHELSLDDGHQIAIERDVAFFKKHL
jgi:uncharacterized protein